MYFTAIIDWCSRKIVGWNLSDTLGLQPVLEAVRSAVDRFGTPSILNSDQGILIRNQGQQGSICEDCKLIFECALTRWSKRTII